MTHRRPTPEKSLLRTGTSVIARAACLALVDHEALVTTAHRAEPGRNHGWNRSSTLTAWNNASAIRFRGAMRSFAHWFSFRIALLFSEPKKPRPIPKPSGRSSDALSNKASSACCRTLSRSSRLVARVECPMPSCKNLRGSKVSMTAFSIANWPGSSSIH